MIHIVIEGIRIVCHNNLTNKLGLEILYKEEKTSLPIKRPILNEIETVGINSGKSFKYRMNRVQLGHCVAWLKKVGMNEVSHAGSSCYR